MRNFHIRKNSLHYHCPTVNLDNLWTLVSDQTRQKYKIVTDKAPVIDCVRAVRHVTTLGLGAQSSKAPVGLRSSLSQGDLILESVPPRKPSWRQAGFPRGRQAETLVPQTSALRLWYFMIR